jgi:hypothetical protein
MERGRIVWNKMNTEDGYVELEGKRYNYQLQNTSSPVMVIYENNTSQPWISCNVDSAGSDLVFSSFLLGLCWYIFLQQEKESLVYAA